MLFTLYPIIVVPSAGIDRQLRDLYPIPPILNDAITSTNASNYIEPPFLPSLTARFCLLTVTAGGQECGSTKSG